MANTRAMARVNLFEGIPTHDPENRLAVVAVFVVWTALDFVIHGLILAKAYQETAPLWTKTREGCKVNNFM